MQKSASESMSGSLNKGLGAYGISARSGLNFIPRGARRFIRNRTPLQFVSALREWLPVGAGGSSLEVSEYARPALESLRTNGFATLRHGKFLALAKEISERYQALLGEAPKSMDDAGQAGLDGLPAVYRKNSALFRIGNHQWQLSLKDAALLALASDRDIHSVLSGYTRNQLYLREDPILEHYHYTGQELGHDVGYYAAAFHTDPFRQINVTLLLEDLSEEMTVTEYAMGSNRRNVLLGGFNLEYPRSNDLLHYGQYPLAKLTGKRGDVLLMDATGLHRVRPAQGKPRKWVVMVVNPGSVVPGIKSALTSGMLPSDLTRYGRRFLKHAVRG